MPEALRIVNERYAIMRGSVEVAYLEVGFDEAEEDEYRRTWATVDTVFTLYTYRRRGYASQLLETVCDHADREGLELHLFVAPLSLEVPRAALVDLYSRFDFRLVNPDAMLMIRKPDWRRLPAVARSSAGARARS